jgi:DNA-nicking Smr family endonuclease
VRDYNGPVSTRRRGPCGDDDTSDVDVFERAMADVIRIQPDPRGRIRTAPSQSSPPPRAPDATDADAQAGRNFAAAGVDRREIRKLRRGEHRVGERCDLHGMTLAEACDTVQRLIAGSRRRRLRCVCIVHGRGLHSERGTSRLKARVRECLRSNASVLAYADAPASDGGEGAVYVLLRR